MEYLDDLMDSFKKYCPKCGSKEPNCDTACYMLYRKLDNDSYIDSREEKNYIARMMQDCGDKKCGRVLINLYNLEKDGDNYE